MLIYTYEQLGNTLLRHNIQRKAFLIFCHPSHAVIILPVLQHQVMMNYQC